MYKGFIKDVLNARDTTSLNIVEPSGKTGGKKSEFFGILLLSNMDATQPQSILEAVLTRRERIPNLDRVEDGVLEKLGPFTGKDVTRFS